MSGPRCRSQDAGTVAGMGGLAAPTPEDFESYQHDTRGGAGTRREGKTWGFPGSQPKGGAG